MHFYDKYKHLCKETQFPFAEQQKRSDKRVLHSNEGGTYTYTHKWPSWSGQEVQL